MAIIAKEMNPKIDELQPKLGGVGCKILQHKSFPYDMHYNFNILLLPHLYLYVFVQCEENLVL